MKLNIDSAIEILNKYHHRGVEWEKSGDNEITPVDETDYFTYLTEFEAVAIAERYQRENIEVDPHTMICPYCAKLTPCQRFCRHCHNLIAATGGC